MADFSVYFHSPYYGMHSPRNSIRFVNVLKNDFQEYSAEAIARAEAQLVSVLTPDFAELSQMHGPMAVVGVPRSKRDCVYGWNRSGLKRGIRAAVANVPALADGLDWIVRVRDTQTTHLRRWRASTLPPPYPGIALDTCRFSPFARGRNILLVDDIYTEGVGIDEDMVDALYAHGAANVVFYAIGKTVRHG